MNQISVKSLISGLDAVCAEKPTFKVGHDGSNKKCDAIGLLRGGLMRGGATKIRDMKEINQFVRKTAIKIQPNDSDVRPGNVLLKVAKDELIPLPSKYRTGDLATNDMNNYIDIGIVVSKNPNTVLQMTVNGIKKDSKLSEWDYKCWLPYVIDGGHESMESAVVRCEKGVKMYASTSFSSECLADISNGTRVMVIENNGTWANISFGSMNGFVLSRFLVDEPKKDITIDRDELEKAYVIIGKLLGYIK